MLLTITAPAYKEFFDFLEKNGAATYSKVSHLLFHYTKVSALKGILSSRVLWFTNIFTQKSDPFEIRSGVDICYQLLDEHSSKVMHPGAKFFIEKFKKILQVNIEQSGQFFLFCASGLQDDPHLWMEFADNGEGVCLEFASGFSENFTDTLENDDGCFSNGTSPVFEVFYDDEVLRCVLRPIIEKCMDCVNRGLEAANPNKDEGWLFLREMSTLLASNCLPHCTEYKPEKFSKEKETRFLRIIRADRTPRYLPTKKIGGEAKVPLVLPLQEKDLKAIWLGPLAPVTMQAWLKKILLENNWNSVEIKLSKIPFS